MAEYIKRGDAIDAVLDVYCDTPDIDLSCEKFEAAILKIPAADVAPVQHGRWIATHDEFCSCSVCKYPVYVAWGQTNYCPNCGAKMAEKAVKEEACQNGGN